MSEAAGPPARLVQVVEHNGQQHLLANWHKLNPDQQNELTTSLESMDFAALSHAFTASMASAEESKAALEPVTDVTTQQGMTADQRSEWTRAGYAMIAEGRYAVLVLAGGQGSRLGSAAPKGCYDIGLPSRKSLFRLQAERIGRLQRLAAEAVFGAGTSVRHPLRLYLMTSSSTDAATRAQFEQHAYFGLARDQVVFFQQGQLPCLTLDGRVIMATGHSISQAPDGNGGLYLALQKSGALAHMAAHGVEAVDCCSVDNVLAPLGDPLFAGHCWSREAECGARVVAKRSASEKVGVFARRGGAVEVVEYSELGTAEAEAVLDDGRLKYGASNVCMHYFRRDFLERVAARLVANGRFHIARKQIPSKDGPVQGVKLELFIFDTFPFANRVALLEVPRAQQFSPVKNAPGAAEDSPDTARRDVMALHAGWVEAAGGVVEAAGGVEVSPTVSYAGEGLQQICGTRTFRQPYNDALQAIATLASLLPAAAAAGNAATARCALKGLVDIIVFAPSALPLLAEGGAHAWRPVLLQVRRQACASLMAAIALHLELVSGLVSGAIQLSAEAAKTAAMLAALDIGSIRAAAEAQRGPAHKLD